MESIFDSSFIVFRNFTSSFWLLFIIIFSGALSFNLSGCGNGLQSKPTPAPTSTPSPSPTASPETYSISGKVLFASTTDGIRDGVTITISGETATYTTTTEIDTGTYEVTGLGSGEYRIYGYKNGWTISNINTTIDASSLTSQNITAEPNFWTVSYIGGSNANIVSVDGYRNELTAIASGLGAPYYTSTDTGETWTEHPQTEITTEAISLSMLHVTPAGSLEIDDTTGRVWKLDKESTNWYVDEVFTLEVGVAAKAYEDLSTNIDILLGTNGMFYYSVDKGDTFVRCDSAGSGLNNLTSFNDEVLIVGDNGLINYLSSGLATPEADDWLSKNLPSSSSDVVGVTTADDDNLTYSARLVLVSTSRGEVLYGYPKISDTWTSWLSGVPYGLNVLTEVESSNTLADLTGMMIFGDNGLILKRN